MAVADSAAAGKFAAVYYATRKNIKISFSDNNKINENTFHEIVDYLIKVKKIKKTLTLPAPLILEETGDSVFGVLAGVFMPNFKSQLKNCAEFLYYENNPKNAFINVRVEDDKLIVSLAGVFNCVLHNIEINQKTYHEQFVNYVMEGFLFILSLKGDFESAARIIFHKEFKNKFPTKFYIGLFNIFLNKFLSTSRIDEIVNKIHDLIDADDEYFDAIAIASLVNHPLGSDKLKPILMKLLSKHKQLNNRNNTGMFYYNLGNFESNQGNYKQACLYFFEARKYRKEYTESSYFYEELAGALFLLGKYRFSAKIYKIAINKGASKKVLARYADALMFGGYYQQAYDIFSDYFKTECIADGHNCEYFLKKITLKRIIDLPFGIKEQIRQKEQAVKLADISGITKEFHMNRLDSATQLDALCGLAWFNFGVSFIHLDNVINLEKYERATFCFLLSALIHNHDIEAWSNAAICSIYTEAFPHMFFHILRAAHCFHGDEFIASINNSLMLNFKENEFTEEQLKNITKLINDFLSGKKQPQIPPTIRILKD